MRYAVTLDSTILSRMNAIKKYKISDGIYLIRIEQAALNLLCGCPADAIKHLTKQGFIQPDGHGEHGFETGPNAILLSDIAVQKGSFANLSEFPVLHMLYKQGMGIPGHPNHEQSPILVGLKEQIESQLHYVHRGNYGLLSKSEIMQCNISEAKADQLMAVKLGFAMGEIHPEDKFLDTVVLENEPKEIINKVYINRVQVNVFQISYLNESVIVDLNLKENECYQPSYHLGHYYFKREYFAVIHAGDGDGWDQNRPCMASILMFQGKIYLIDMPPNLLHHLNALGIGINEIEGVFHTHCHDDHFAGITSLISGEHKIKYYATSLVRSSVAKKLAGLLNIEEKQFYDFFDVHDLMENHWNDVNDLNVLPLLSPHPVETNIYYFRVLSHDGYRCYGHLADLISMDVLENVVENDHTGILNRDYIESVKKAYFMRADIKKIDVGGGPVHGDGEDFIDDSSGKIILSHTSNALNHRQKLIGSDASFGVVDVLISNNSEFVRRSAYDYLSSYFPFATRHQLRGLLNNELIVFNPGTFVLKQGEISDGVFLILTGNIEIMQSDNETVRMMSAGGVVGDMSIIEQKPSDYSYRTKSYVQAIHLSDLLYSEFVHKNDLITYIQKLDQRRVFLQNTDLLGDSIPFPIQNRIANNMVSNFYEAGERVSEANLADLNFIKDGCIAAKIDEQIVDLLGEYEVFGEQNPQPTDAAKLSYEAIQDTEVFLLDIDIVKDIPIVRWKLLELSSKLKGALLTN